MTKRSKTMPKGEAKPLGTPRTKQARRMRIVRKPGEESPTVEKNFSNAEENSGQEQHDEVGSVQPAMMPQDKEQKTMTLTFKGYNRKNTAAIYSGLRTSFRLPLAAFENRQAPQTLELQGPLAAPATPKAKLTDEEKAQRAAQRKAERANKPKPTLAERIASREAALAKLKEKAAKQEQPSL